MYKRQVVAKGLMEGTRATAFSPDEPFTRGMLATILWRLEESPVVNYTLSFNDVAEGQWYTCLLYTSRCV